MFALRFNLSLVSVLVNTSAVIALRLTAACVAYPAMVPFAVGFSVINAEPFTVSPPSVFTPTPPNVSPNGLFVLKPATTCKLSTVAVSVNDGLAMFALSANELLAS